MGNPRPEPFKWLKASTVKKTGVHVKIAFFEVKEWEKKFLRKRLPEYDLAFFETALSQDDVPKIENCDALSVFIYSKVTKEIITKLPHLKLIATRSTGFDHVDIGAAKKRKVQVSNVPYYGENTVAEHTFALILALSRNVHKSYMRTVQNNFSIDGLKGFDLAGKTLGVIGCGHIGLHVIKIAKGFGMRVLAYDMRRDTFLSEVMGFEYSSMDDVLARSDIISLHLPYLKSTHHILNKEKFSLMKKGAILINTARGGLVDTEALVWALDTGVLGGAGLDVIEGEEFIKEEKQLLADKGKAKKVASLIRDHILLKKDNVVFTPHIAFFSQEALERILLTTVDTIHAFEKKKAINVVG